jgi:succinate-semialdehyde dehydrogenase/glutarate-semialdehyde dehydrogenase
VAGSRCTSDGPGAVYAPTVLTGCTEDMAVMSQETFGPAAAVQVVDSFDGGAAMRESIAAYGLAATVLSADLGRVQRAVRELPIGAV